MEKKGRGKIEIGSASRFFSLPLSSREEEGEKKERKKRKKKEREHRRRRHRCLVRLSSFCDLSQVKEKREREKKRENRCGVCPRRPLPEKRK